MNPYRIVLLHHHIILTHHPRIVLTHHHCIIPAHHPHTVPAHHHHIIPTHHPHIIPSHHHPIHSIHLIQVSPQVYCRNRRRVEKSWIEEKSFWLSRLVLQFRHPQKNPQNYKKIIHH